MKLTVECSGVLSVFVAAKVEEKVWPSARIEELDVWFPAGMNELLLSSSEGVEVKDFLSLLEIDSEVSLSFAETVKEDSSFNRNEEDWSLTGKPVLNDKYEVVIAEERTAGELESFFGSSA